VSPVDVYDLMEATVPRDIEAAGLTRERLDGLVKPLGSLGRLEELAAWLAGVQGQCPPRPLDRVRVVVFAGDHGVARGGVSAYPPEVTAAMVRTFVAGRAGVSVLARQHGAGVRVLDLGVDADLGDLGADVTRFKVRRGSGSIDREDALTQDELDAAFTAGCTVADEEVDAGADLLIAGDMGIGNSTVAAALVGASLSLSPLDVVGSGTGVDDEGWARKVAALRDALHRARRVRGDGLALLRTIGSADTAAMTGFLLQAAARKTPVLLDGVVSCACALVGRRMVEDSRHWWLAGHRSTEPAQRRALEVLGLEPLVDLGMRLGEGTGALTALPLLRSAQALCAEMGTLAELGMVADGDTGAAEAATSDAHHAAPEVHPAAPEVPPDVAAATAPDPADATADGAADLTADVTAESPADHATSSAGAPAGAPATLDPPSADSPA
jgi:nicotinate-nucleotide--dimethylbenzimidazole phosphoribosyltransferase